MSIPQWYAGQVITADRLNARNLNIIMQSGNQIATTTSLQASEITASFEPGAVYAYWCYISYTAHFDNDFQWQWAGTNVTLASFTQALAPGNNTGHNASRPSIFRRPGNTIVRIAGGTSNLPATSVNQTAYDAGTLFTGSGDPTITLMFAKYSNETEDQPTTLNGGNQTRFLYQRIA